jgi:hypothetical protein
METTWKNTFGKRGGECWWSRFFFEMCRRFSYGNYTWKNTFGKRGGECSFLFLPRQAHEFRTRGPWHQQGTLGRRWRLLLDAVLAPARRCACARSRSAPTACAASPPPRELHVGAIVLASVTLTHTHTSLSAAEPHRGVPERIRALHRGQRKPVHCSRGHPSLLPEVQPLFLGRRHSVRHLRYCR